MLSPLQITFRNTDTSDFVEQLIREKAEKLEQFATDIIAMHVVVEEPHRSHTKGNHWHVRVEFSVPGHDFVVTREPHDKNDHEDIRIAVRDAFDAARRELIDYNTKRRDQSRVGI